MKRAGTGSERSPVFAGMPDPENRKGMIGHSVDNQMRTKPVDPHMTIELCQNRVGSWKVEKSPKRPGQRAQVGIGGRMAELRDTIREDMIEIRFGQMSEFKLHFIALCRARTRS